MTLERQDRIWIYWNIINHTYKILDDDDEEYNCKKKINK